MTSSPRGPTTNPFLPGSDVVPPVWAGREAELAEARGVVAARRLAGVHERGRLVLGEFGIGKSVLVNRLAAEAAEDGHRVLRQVRLAVGVDPVAALVAAGRELLETSDLDARLGRRAGALLRRVEEVSLPLVGGGVKMADGPDDGPAEPHRVLTGLLVALAEQAREDTDAAHPDGRLVVVRLDEVQNVRTASALSQLLTGLGDALEATRPETDAAGITRQRALPLTVYLSGLPDLGRQAAAAGATFSRRFRVWELDPLSETEIRTALLPFTTDGWPLLGDDGPVGVHLEPEAVPTVVELCLGDPFLFQLAGEAAWNAGTGLVVTADEVRRGWAGARREVERYVRSRLDGLTDLQLAYLEAAAGLEPERRTTAEVARALGREGSSGLGSTAAALDGERGLIRRETGRIRFRSAAVEAHLSGSWP